MAALMMTLSALAAAYDGSDDELLSALEAADNGNNDEVFVSTGVS
jgi:hypothetical protein